MTNILNKLKGLIVSEGETISGAAQKAGMGPQNILNKMSRGTLKAVELEKLCQAIGFDVDFKKKQ